jgi:hypothetical protein
VPKDREIYTIMDTSERPHGAAECRVNRGSILGATLGRRIGHRGEVAR